MMQNEDKQFKHEIALQTFLSEMEWTDELEYNFDKRFVSLSTPITIGGNDNLLIVEAHENDLIDVYVYLRYLTVKHSKIEQMHILLSLINANLRVGKFQYMQRPEWQVIRWQHAADFEGSNPNGTTIRHNVITGLNTVEDYAVPIAAVALTNQTADQALEEFNESRKPNGENTH